VLLLAVLAAEADEQHAMVELCPAAVAQDPRLVVHERRVRILSRGIRISHEAPMATDTRWRGCDTTWPLKKNLVTPFLETVPGSYSIHFFHQWIHAAETHTFL